MKYQPTFSLPLSFRLQTKVSSPGPKWHLWFPYRRCHETLASAGIYQSFLAKTWMAADFDAVHKKLWVITWLSQFFGENGGKIKGPSVKAYRHLNKFKALRLMRTIFEDQLLLDGISSPCRVMSHQSTQHMRLRNGYGYCYIFTY